MEPENCWHCGHAPESSLFCRYCNSLQRPKPDYYRFLGLERKLHLDPDDLQQRFYRLSRLLHPDRYLRRTATERQYSLEATAILNDAYRTLRTNLQFFQGEHPLRTLLVTSAGPSEGKSTTAANLALSKMRAG